MTAPGSNPDAVLAAGLEEAFKLGATHGAKEVVRMQAEIAELKERLAIAEAERDALAERVLVMEAQAQELLRQATAMEAELAELRGGGR